MSEPTWYEFEVLAPDVQKGDKLFDRLSPKPFLWPNGKLCPGIVGPFLITEVRRRGRIVEFVDSGGAVHLHRMNELLLIHRAQS